MVAQGQPGIVPGIRRQRDRLVCRQRLWKRLRAAAADARHRIRGEFTALSQPAEIRTPRGQHARQRRGRQTARVEPGDEAADLVCMQLRGPRPGGQLLELGEVAAVCGKRVRRRASLAAEVVEKALDRWSFSHRDRPSAWPTARLRLGRSDCILGAQPRQRGTREFRDPLEEGGAHRDVEAVLIGRSEHEQAEGGDPRRPAAAASRDSARMPHPRTMSPPRSRRWTRKTGGACCWRAIPPQSRVWRTQRGVLRPDRPHTERAMRHAEDVLHRRDHRFGQPRRILPQQQSPGPRHEV